MELINNWISMTTDFFNQPITDILSWFSGSWHGLVSLTSKIGNLLNNLDSDISKSLIPILNSLLIPLTLLYIANSVMQKVAKEEKNKQKRLLESEQKQQDYLAQVEKNRQEDNQNQALLRDFCQHISALLIDKELSTQKHEHPTARVARALTLSAMTQLDSMRNEMLTRFLVESQLIQTKPSDQDKNCPTLLKGADLEGSNLINATLKDADLEVAHLKNANLENARLDNAYLFGASLINTNLKDANLSNTNLIGTELINANLVGANLSGANLSNANLVGANLSGADLSNADLFGANLTRVQFEHTNLKNTLFGKNSGIDKDLKADLIKRGAIFEDSPIATPSATGK